MSLHTVGLGYIGNVIQKLTDPSRPLQSGGLVLVVVAVPLLHSIM